MGSGVVKGVSVALERTTADELSSCLHELPPEQLALLRSAMPLSRGAATAAEQTAGPAGAAGGVEEAEDDADAAATVSTAAGETVTAPVPSDTVGLAMEPMETAAGAASTAGAAMDAAETAAGAHGVGLAASSELDSVPVAAGIASAATEAAADSFELIARTSDGDELARLPCATLEWTRTDIVRQLPPPGFGMTWTIVCGEEVMGGAMTLGQAGVAAPDAEVLAIRKEDPMKRAFDSLRGTMAFVRHEDPDEVMAGLQTMMAGFGRRPGPGG